MADRIEIGISRCLLGEKVRYDGEHRRDSFLVDTMGRYAEFEAVCPEAECGLGVPREPVQLVGDPAAPRLVTVRTEEDHTGKMRSWAAKRLDEFREEHLFGFIFKEKSPSCGLQRVKIYGDRGMVGEKGRGLFAGMFTDSFPLIPVAEDGHLRDPVLRETFIEQIFALKRWRDAKARGRTRGNLVDFHTCHKMLLLSHSPRHYREMGRLVVQDRAKVERLYGAYESLLLEALALKATVKKHVSVLQHAMGYLRRRLSPGEKQEVVGAIDQYRYGRMPLIVPLTILTHYVRWYGEPYLSRQVYLNPHPVELKLKNHA